MAVFINLGTEETPRWINLENISVTSARRGKAPGKSEVIFRGVSGKDEMASGDAADRVITQLEANPKLGKGPGY